jgi:hypothetical protein
MEGILNMLWAAQRLLSAALGAPAGVLVTLLSLPWHVRRGHCRRPTPAAPQLLQRH